MSEIRPASDSQPGNPHTLWLAKFLVVKAKQEIADFKAKSCIRPEK